MIIKTRLAFIFLGCWNFFLYCGCHAHRNNTDVTAAGGPLMVCYYMPTKYLPVESIPADICTHIIYSYAEVSPTGILAPRPHDTQNYKALVSLKEKNPRLKVMLSLQQGFRSVVSNGSVEIMANFSHLAVTGLKKFGFDGIDLDWEYPDQSDKSNFKSFIKIFSSYLKKADLLLSVALPNSPYRYKRGYITETINNHADFLTAMTYDFHVYTRKDNVTGFNSPLKAPRGEMAVLSTAGMIQFYTDTGITPSKLLMGLPLYGRSWTLRSSEQHGLHAQATGVGEGGPFAHYRGIYIYPDVCLALQRGAHLVYDKSDGAAYLYADQTWVAFDNEDTIKEKISYMKSHGLGGVGVWAMHLDDVPGLCNKGPLPLLHTIKSAL